MKRPLRPGPDHAAALLMGMIFGALMGGPAVHEWLYRPTAEALQKAEQTSEILLKHSDDQACALFRTGLTVRQAPGLEWIARNGEASADQIKGNSWPEKLDWCRGER